MFIGYHVDEKTPLSSIVYDHREQVLRFSRSPGYREACRLISLKFQAHRSLAYTIHESMLNTRVSFTLYKRWVYHSNYEPATSTLWCFAPVFRVQAWLVMIVSVRAACYYTVHEAFDIMGAPTMSEISNVESPLVYNDSSVLSRFNCVELLPCVVERVWPLTLEIKYSGDCAKYELV